MFLSSDLILRKTLHLLPLLAVVDPMHRSLFLSNSNDNMVSAAAVDNVGNTSAIARARSDVVFLINDGVLNFILEVCEGGFLVAEIATWVG